MYPSSHLNTTSRRLARRALSIVAVCLITGTPALAQNAPPALDPEQEALVEDLTHALVAPCCWTASVADHGSGQAPVVEAEIRGMVAQGMTRQAILDHYVEKFGERILVEPRRQGFNVLAYWIPWIAVGVGALGIVWFVKRRQPHEETVAATLPETGTDPYRRRVREELDRLDD
jgi:cytochrome c-type biogenesis protein CcmH